MTISRAYSALVATPWVVVPYLVATLMAFGLSVFCAGYLHHPEGTQVPWVAPPVKLILSFERVQ